MKKLFSVDEGKDITNELYDTEVSAVKVEKPIEPVDGVVEIKPEPKASKVGKINVATLNIRSEAKANASVIKVLPINTELKIKEESNDFFEIVCPDGTPGFCKKQFVTVL
jgi:hypothetical protein